MSTKTVLLVCLILGGCIKKSETPNSLNLEEYEVYTAVLNRFAIHPNSMDFSDSLWIIPIFQKTVNGYLLGEHNSFKNQPKYWMGDSSLSLRQFSTSGEWDLMVSNFKTVWGDSLVIDTSKIDTPIKCIPFSYYERQLTWEPWKYPGFIYFSRVGFNSTKTEAIVYYRREGEEGESMILLLSKKNGNWDVENGVCLFISGPELSHLKSIVRDPASSVP